MADPTGITVIGEALPDPRGAIPGPSSWTQALADILLLRGQDVPVEDCTRPGWTAHKIMEHITDDVLHQPPAVLIVHTGVADAQGQLRADRWSKDPAAFARSLAESIGRVQRKHPRVRVLLLTPVLASRCRSPFRLGPLQDLLPAYRAQVHAVAAQTGAAVIDAHDLIQQGLEGSLDDLRYGGQPQALTLPGAIVLADAIAGYLAPGHDRRILGLAAGELVLGVGDSITDGNRREPALAPLGLSFFACAEALVAARAPGLGTRWVNRGTGGDTVVDLASRWDRDVLAHRPDVVCVTSGLNDMNRRYADGGEGIEPDRYGTILGELLARTRQALPRVRLVMVGSFAFTRDDFAGSYNAELARRLPPYLAMAKATCERHHAVFVDGQAALGALFARHRPRRFTSDGLHPNLLGSLALAEPMLVGVAQARPAP